MASKVVGEAQYLEIPSQQGKPCIGKAITQALLIIIGIAMLLSPIIIVCVGKPILPQESMVMVSLVVFIMGVVAITSASLSGAHRWLCCSRG